MLLASPLTRTLAVGGTLVFGSGCGGPSHDECELWLDECVELCDPQDYACVPTCNEAHYACLDEADLAAQQREAAAEGAADFAIACVAVTACALESLGDGDGDGDGDSWSDPEPEPDDWGEDWGEQVVDEAGELEAPEAESWGEGVPADLGG